MDIERLKELREEVFEDYKAYMVKNLKDEDGKVYPSTVPLDECSPIGKDLTALIDAELARQSATDEAVQRAIEWLEAEKESVQTAWERSDADWRMEYGVNETHGERMAAFDLAITALRQYQKPTDEEIEKAIGSFEMCKAMMLFDPLTGETHAIENENQDNQDLYHACNLAQVALHQMRTEPCKWCAEKEDSLLVWTKDPVEIEWDDREYTTRGKRAGSEEIMKRFTKLLRIEYEDKWVVEDAFEDESGLIRGKAIDCLAQYETANEGLGCEECFGVAGMEIPLSTGIKSVNFCPICGRRF